MTNRFLVLAVLAGVSVAVPAFAADPASVAAPDVKTGDAWVYDSTVEQGASGFSKALYAVQIDDVRDDTLIVGIKPQGAPTAFVDHEMGLDWSDHRLSDGQSVTTERPFDFPMAIGKSWVVDYDDPVRHGLQTLTHVHKTCRVTGWEDVVTPAGTFHALRIEAHGMLKADVAASTGGVSGVSNAAGSATTIVHAQSTPAHVEYGTTYARIYYAPQVKGLVKSVHETYNASGVRTHRETRLLQSYKPAT